MNYSNKQSKKKKYYRIRDNRHTYTILLYRTRPPTAVTHKPKLKGKKEKGTSLVTSWAGPLAWAKSRQDGCAPWRPYTLGHRRGCSLDAPKCDWSATRVLTHAQSERIPGQKLHPKRDSEETALVRHNEPPNQTQEERPPTAPRESTPSPRERPQLEESEAA